MKTMESRLQNGILTYKWRISLTKMETHLQEVSKPRISVYKRDSRPAINLSWMKLSAGLIGGITRIEKCKI